MRDLLLVSISILASIGIARILIDQFKNDIIRLIESIEENEDMKIELITKQEKIIAKQEELIANQEKIIIRQNNSINRQNDFINNLTRRDTN